MLGDCSAYQIKGNLDMPKYVEKFPVMSAPNTLTPNPIG